MKYNLFYIAILSIFYSGKCQEVSLSSVFSMATDNIYTINKSETYNDSIIYSIGSFEGDIETNSIQLTTNYSRGVFLLKTTTNNEFISFHKIAENEFQVVLEPTLALHIDSNENIIVGIGFRDKLFYSDDSITINDTENNNQAICLLKLNNEAIITWDKIIYANSLGTDGVKFDSSGNLLVVGSNNNNFFLTKFDILGDSLWTRTGGASNSNVPVGGGSVVVDEENNYYCSGGLTTSNIIYFDQEHPTFNTLDFGKYGSFLAKYDLSGNIQWLKCLFASSEQIQIAPIKSVSIKDNKVLVSGMFNSNYLRSSPNEGSIGPNNTDNLYNGFLIMYTNEGERIWSKKTHTNENGDVILNCSSISDENFIYTTSNFKASMIVNGTLVSGGSFGNEVIEKFTIDGTILGHFLIEGPAFEKIRDLKILQNDIFVFGTTNNNPLIINGTPINLNANPSFFITKLHDNIVSTDELKLNNFSIYPNPTNSSIILQSKESLLGKEVNIYNALGELMSRQKMNHLFENEILLPESTGVYFIRMDELNFIKRVVKN